MSIYEDVQECIGTRPCTWLVTGMAGFIRSQKAGELPDSMADGVRP